MNLNELRDRAYNIAKAHGWHDTEHSDETLLMLVITEIAEAVQADRKNLHADMEAFDKYDGRIPFPENFERHVKDTVEDELADAVIRLLDFAGMKGIDLETIPVKLPNGTFPEHCFNLCGMLTNINVEFDWWVVDAINGVISYIFNYCRQKGIDIEFLVQKKMEYNETRPYRHGKAY